MEKDPYIDDDLIHDDEFSFDDLDSFSGKNNDLFADTIEGLDTDAERSPMTDSTVNTRVLKTGALTAGRAAGSTLKRKIENEFPEVQSLISEALNLTSDVSRLRDDFVKDMRPTVQQLKITGKRALPMIEDVVPKSVIDKLDKFLSTTDHGGYDSTEPSKEDTQNLEIEETLKNIFKAEKEIDRHKTRKAEVNLMIDRHTSKSQHKELATMLNDLRTFTMHQTRFNNQISLPYMKKVLELKYQHLWTSKDILEVLKLTAQVTEKKLDEIRHNTALPDNQKERLTEAYREEMRDRMIGSVSDYVGNFTKNVLGNVKEKVLGPTKDMTEMFGDLASGFLDGMEMENEMHEMMGTKPLSMQERAGQKFMSLIGEVGGTKASGGVSKFLSNHRGNIELFAGNAKLNSILAANKAADGGFDNPLLTAIADALVPRIDKSAGSLSNKLFTDPTAPASYDVATRTAIIETIPGYLGKILQQVTIANTKGPVDELVYDEKTRDFITVKALQRDRTEMLFGDKQSRQEQLRSGIEPLRESVNKNNQSALTTFDKVQDQLGTVFYNLAIAKDFPLVNTDLIKEAYLAKDTGHSEYITKALKGVKSPLQVLEVLYISLFKQDGSVDTSTYLQWTRSIQDYIVNGMDGYKSSVATHVLDMGHTRHLKNIFSTGSSDGSLVIDDDKLKSIMTDSTVPITEKSTIKEDIDERRSSLWKKRKDKTNNTSMGGRIRISDMLPSPEEALPEVDKDTTSREVVDTSALPSVNLDLDDLSGIIDDTERKMLGISKTVKKQQNVISDIIEGSSTKAIKNTNAAWNKTTANKGTGILGGISGLKNWYTGSEGTPSGMVSDSTTISLLQTIAEHTAGLLEATTTIANKEGVMSKIVKSPFRLAGGTLKLAGRATLGSAKLTTKVAGGIIKAPFKLVGGAAGMLGGNDSKRFEDIYLLGDEDSGPLCTKKQLKKGLMFEDGKIITHIREIDRPVYNPYMDENGHKRKPDSDTTPMMVITPDDLKTGLVTTSGVILGDKASRGGAFGKTKSIGGSIVGGAFKAVTSVGGAAASVAMGAISSTTDVARRALTPFTDVYTKNLDEGFVLLVSGKELERVGVYADGRPVKSAYEIKGPVWNASTGELLIEENDLKNGLYDAKGKPLSRVGIKAGNALAAMGRMSVSAATLLAKGAVMGLKGAVSAATSLGKMAFKSKNPYVDVFVKGEIDPSRPVLRGEGIRNGDYCYANGTLVESAYGIRESVYTVDDEGGSRSVGNILIDSEDIKKGLVDINNSVLSSWAGRSLVGKAVSGIAGIAKGVFKVGAGILKGTGGMLGGFGFGGRNALKEFVGDKLDVIIAILSQRMPLPAGGTRLALSYGNASQAERQAIKQGVLYTGVMPAPSPSAVAKAREKELEKLTEDTRHTTRIKEKARERERERQRKRKGEDLTGSPIRTKESGTILGGIAKSLATMAAFALAMKALPAVLKGLQKWLGKADDVTKGAQNATKNILNTTATGTKVANFASKFKSAGGKGLNTAVDFTQAGKHKVVADTATDLSRLPKLAVGLGGLGYVWSKLTESEGLDAEGKHHEARKERGAGYGAATGGTLGMLLGPKFSKPVAALVGMVGGSWVGKNLADATGDNYDDYDRVLAKSNKPPAVFALYGLRRDAYGFKQSVETEKLIGEMEQTASRVLRTNESVSDEQLGVWMTKLKCIDEKNPGESLAYFRKYWEEKFMPIFIMYNQAVNMVGSTLDTIDQDLEGELARELFDLLKTNINDSDHLKNIAWVVPYKDGIATYIQKAKLSNNAESFRAVNYKYAEQLKTEGISDSRDMLHPTLQATAGVGAGLAITTHAGRRAIKHSLGSSLDKIDNTRLGNKLLSGGRKVTTGAMKVGSFAGHGKMDSFNFELEKAKNLRALDKKLGMPRHQQTSVIKAALKNAGKFDGGYGGKFGRLMGAATVGWEAYKVHDLYSAGKKMEAAEQSLKSAGMIGGSVVGAKLVGSFAAGVGTATTGVGGVVTGIVGGAVGGILGGIIGAEGMDTAGRRIVAAFDDEAGPGFLGAKRRYEWSLFKQRCDMYGIDPRKYESTVDSLEQYLIDRIEANPDIISGKSDKPLDVGINEEEALKYSKAFGLDVKKNPKAAVRYFVAWYKMKFIPILVHFYEGLVGRLGSEWDEQDYIEKEQCDMLIGFMENTARKVIDPLSAITMDNTGFTKWVAEMAKGGIEFDAYSNEDREAKKRAIATYNDHLAKSKLDMTEGELDTFMALSKNKNKKRDQARAKIDANKHKLFKTVTEDAAIELMKVKDLNAVQAAAMIAASSKKDISLDQAVKEQTARTKATTDLTNKIKTMYPTMFGTTTTNKGVDTKFNKWFSEEEGPGTFFNMGRYSWGLFKYRCSLYGINHGLYLDLIEDLEEDTLEWIQDNKGNPILDIRAPKNRKNYNAWTNAERKGEALAHRVALDVFKSSAYLHDFPKSNEYILEWYRHRFLPIFFMYQAVGLAAVQNYTKDEEDVEDIADIIDDADEEGIGIAASIMQALSIGSANITTNFKELTLDKEGYQLWYKHKLGHGDDTSPYKALRTTKDTPTKTDIAKDTGKVDYDKKIQDQAKAKAAGGETTKPNKSKDDGMETVTILAPKDTTTNSIGTGVKVNIPEETNLAKITAAQKELTKEATAATRKSMLKYPKLFGVGPAVTAASSVPMQYKALFTDPLKPGETNKDRYLKGTLKYRCKLYGVIDTLNLLQEIDDLEVMTYEWFVENDFNPELPIPTTFVDGDATEPQLKAKKIMNILLNKVSTNDLAKYPNMPKYILTWYKERFLPIFFLYVQVAGVVVESVLGKDLINFKADIGFLYEGSDEKSASAASTIMDTLAATSQGIISNKGTITLDITGYTMWNQVGKEVKPNTYKDVKTTIPSTTEKKADDYKNNPPASQTKDPGGTTPTPNSTTGGKIPGNEVLDKFSKMGGSLLEGAKAAGNKFAAALGFNTGGTTMTGGNRDNELLPGGGHTPGGAVKPGENGNRLGDMMKQFESGTLGSRAIGYDRVGGTSYGKFQIAAAPGGFAEFVDFARQKGYTAFYNRMVRALGPVPPPGHPRRGWGNSRSRGGPGVQAWLASVENGELGDLEYMWIEKWYNHFNNQMKRNRPEVHQLINSSAPLQEALWSTVVQQMYGAPKLMYKSYRKGITPKDFITNLYSLRGVQFGSSTAAIQRSAKGRMGREAALLHSWIEREEKAKKDGDTRGSMDPKASADTGSGTTAPPPSPTGGGVTGGANAGAGGGILSGLIDKGKAMLGIGDGGKTPSSTSTGAAGGTGGGTGGAVTPPPPSSSGSVSPPPPSTGGGSSPAGASKPPDTKNINTSKGVHPLPDGTRFMSKFGRSARGGKGHFGIDLGHVDRKDGKHPVVAHKDGKVAIVLHRHASYGNCVYLLHPDGTQTRYAHLFNVCVKQGQQVKAGQELGKMGTTGRSSGVHLHFELRNSHITHRVKGNPDAVDPAFVTTLPRVGGKTGTSAGTDQGPDPSTGGTSPMGDTSVGGSPGGGGGAISGGGTSIGGGSSFHPGDYSPVLHAGGMGAGATGGGVIPPGTGGGYQPPSSPGGGYTGGTQPPSPSGKEGGDDKKKDEGFFGSMGDKWNAFIDKGKQALHGPQVPKSAQESVKRLQSAGITTRGLTLGGGGFKSVSKVKPDFLARFTMAAEEYQNKASANDKLVLTSAYRTPAGQDSLKGTTGAGGRGSNHIKGLAIDVAGPKPGDTKGQGYGTGTVADKFEPIARKYGIWRPHAPGGSRPKANEEQHFEPMKGAPPLPANVEQDPGNAGDNIGGGESAGMTPAEQKKAGAVMPDADGNTDKAKPVTEPSSIGGSLLNMAKGFFGSGGDDKGTAATGGGTKVDKPILPEGAGLPKSPPPPVSVFTPTATTTPPPISPQATAMGASPGRESAQTPMIGTNAPPSVFDSGLLDKDGKLPFGTDPVQLKLLETLSKSMHDVSVHTEVMAKWALPEHLDGMGNKIVDATSQQAPATSAHGPATTAAADNRAKAVAANTGKPGNVVIGELSSRPPVIDNRTTPFS